METEFNTICEDGSTDEIGDLICTMWRQCLEGDYTLVTNALAREYARHRHETLANSQGVDGGDECDSEDELEDTKAVENNSILIQEEIEKNLPVIDEEGFEMIGSGRRSRKPR